MTRFRSGSMLVLAAAFVVGTSRAAPPVVSILDAHVVEGASGTSELRFAIEASGPPRRVQLDFTVSDLTASAAGGDYSPVPGSVSLVPSPPEIVAHFGTGLFNYVEGIAFAPNGDILAVDNRNNYVYRFSSTGALLQTIGSQGHANGQFFAAITVAVNSFGEIYVADFDRRIQRFSPSGAFLNSWGGDPGTQPSHFGVPWGMAFDALGVLYVCDYGNHRVQKFDRAGAFLGMWSTTVSGEPPYGNPQGIAVDAAGNVYVGIPWAEKFSNTRTRVCCWIRGTPTCAGNAFLPRWPSMPPGIC